MANDGQPPPRRIALGLPGDWTSLSTWHPELVKACRAAEAAGGKWRVAGRYLQSIWQTEDSRVQLRGRWDRLDAELVALDWPLPERGPLACAIDSESARIMVYDPTRGMGAVGRVIFDVQIRLQPDAIETAGPLSAPLSTRPPRQSKTGNDAADDAIVDRLIREGKMREPTDPEAATPYKQGIDHAAAFPRLLGNGTSTKSQAARATAALKRRLARAKQPSPI